MGVLTEVDGGSLAMYCRCYARWLQAESEVQRFLEATGRFDRLRVLVALRYLAAVRQLAGELGLSPAARTRLFVEPAGDLARDGILS
jgi:phage terminase small subunit